MATSTPLDFGAVAGRKSSWSDRLRARTADARPRADEDPFSDEALVARTADGDGAAFELLMSRYQSQVFNFVRWHRGITERSAEDVTQEVFLQLYRAAWQFRGGARFRTWFFTLARNVCRNYLRKQRRRSREEWNALPEEALAVLPDRRLGPQARCERGETQRQVTGAVARLPGYQREVLILREWQDLSYSEIAEVLGVPIGTVRSRLHKARASLMEILTVELDADLLVPAEAAP